MLVVVAFSLFFVDVNINTQIPGIQQSSISLDKENSKLKSKIVTLQLSNLDNTPHSVKLEDSREEYIVVLEVDDNESLALLRQ